MRIALTVWVLAVSAGTSFAECQSESAAAVVVVKEWSVSPIKRSGLSGSKVELSLESKTAKPFRLIDASVSFEDALGGRIASISLDRDSHAKPNGAFKYSGEFLGTDLDRVPGMAKADVLVTACTRAVIYEDGTKEEFIK